MLSGATGIRTSRFFLPDAAAAAEAAPPPFGPAALQIGNPPTTGPAAMRFIANETGERMLLAPVTTGAVAVVTTGDDIKGVCETAKSEPDIPVTP